MAQTKQRRSNKIRKSSPGRGKKNSRSGTRSPSPGGAGKRLSKIARKRIENQQKDQIGRSSIIGRSSQTANKEHQGSKPFNMSD